MNILLATFWEYPHVGGISSYISTLKNGLESKGNNVSVLSYNDIKQEIGRQLTLINLIESYRVLFANLIRKYVSENKVDIIVANDVISLLAAKQANLNLPCLLTVHGYLADEYIASKSVFKNSLEEKYLRAVEEIAYNISDNIVTVDKRLKKYIENVIKNDSISKKICVINNFVDINKFKINNKEKNGESIKILCPRRLTPKNGVIYAVKAINKIIIEGYKVKFIIAGNGEEIISIEKYINEENIEDYVELLGSVDNNNMPDLFNKCDIIIIPSINVSNVEEATSIGAIEAMACGKPVIASNIGGLREIIVDGYNGFLVPEKDPEAIAEKIKYIISNPELSKVIGQNARKTVEEKFSTEVAIKKYYNIYKETIEKYYELRQWPFIIKNSATNIGNKMSILDEEEKKLIKTNTLIIDRKYKDAFKLIDNIHNNLINKYTDAINYMKSIIFTKINDLDNAFKYINIINSMDNDKYKLLYGDILLLKNDFSGAINQYEKIKDDKLRRIRLSLCEFVSQGYIKLKNHDDLIDKCIDIFKENNYKLNITYLPIVNGVTGGMRIIYEQINRLIERGHNVDAISYYSNPEWFDLKLNVRKINIGEKVEKYLRNTDAIVYTFWNQWYEINNLDNTLFLIQGDEFLFDESKLDVTLRGTVKNSHVYSESKFLAVSRFLNDTIQKKYNRNSIVIKNAIDIEKFYCDKIDKENARPRIIIVGNAMLKFKGFDIILKALELVKNKGYDFDVLWITQSQPENCPDYIDVAINPPQDKIPELYRKSDIYICGSYYEACPLPPLEAMASGCAVITTKCGGIDEYAKEGYNCLMSDPGDYESIALNVVKLLENKELRLELVNNGLNTVKEFTWDKAIDILEGTLMANYLDVKPIKSLQIAQNSLSLCLITKDEEKNIARCIDSVKDIVDEIVVVDTGSKDKTVEIAKSFGEKVKVINAKWEDDFSKARNIAIENATSDWILFLDADEEIKKEDVGKIRPLLSDDTVEAYILKFVNYAGTNSSNGLTEIHYNLRLFRNNGKLKYIYPVHENLRNIEENRVPVFKNADVTILHYGYLSETRIEKNKTERYIKLISRYLEEHPDDKFQHGNLAVEYFNAGNYNKALKHLLIATKGMDVNSYAATRLLRYLISTYSALKDYDTALRIINDAKAYYVDVPDFKFLEGMIYIDQKRYKKAIETFKECLSMGEYNGIFITMGGTGSYRAKYMIALCYEKLNKLNDAVKEYMEILKEHPKYQEVFIRVFDMFVRNEKAEDVYEFFNRHVDTKSPVNFAIMARLYINIGRFDIAKQYIDSIDIDLEGLNNLRGIIYMGLKDYENAIKHFEMEYGKAKEEANYREALCYIILKDIDKAKDLLWKITDSSDKKLYMTIVGEMKVKFDEVKDSFFNLLDLLIKLKEFDLYNEVLNLYVGLFTREEYERYGQMMVNNGLDDLAVEAYIKAADLNSQNTEVYKYLAQRAYNQNMFNEALSIISNAYNIDKTDVDIYRLIYKIYKALGQDESADEVNEMIKSMYPEVDLSESYALT